MEKNFRCSIDRVIFRVSRCCLKDLMFPACLQTFWNWPKLPLSHDNCRCLHCFFHIFYFRVSSWSKHVCVFFNENTLKGCNLGLSVPPGQVLVFVEVLEERRLADELLLLTHLLAGAAGLGQPDLQSAEGGPHHLTVAEVLTTQRHRFVTAAAANLKNTKSFCFLLARTSVIVCLNHCSKLVYRVRLKTN